MIINQFNGLKNHPGYQPIRVLFNNISHSFMNYNPIIKNEFQKMVMMNQLSSTVDYKIDTLPIFNKEEIQTPYIRINDGKIVIHEIFVMYLWCISFSIHTPFHKLIHEQYNINSDPYLKHQCDELLLFANKIKTNYEVFDKNKYINPELFEQKYMDVIGYTNAMCINALNFILCHEYNHAKFQLYNGTKQDEELADLEAIKLLKNGSKNDNEIGNRAVAGLLGLGANMLLSKYIQSNTHPDADKRIRDFIKNIGYNDENNELWALACYVYAFWVNEYKIDLDFKINNLNLSYEERFNYLVSQ